MNDLQQRLVRFSSEVLKQTQDAQRHPLLESVAGQLIRSATSAGANYSEAQSASSYRDFHNKIRIALKEMHETQYWLFFLRESGNARESIDTLLKESDELMRIMSTISKKTDPRYSRDSPKP